MTLKTISLKMETERKELQTKKIKETSVTTNCRTARIYKDSTGRSPNKTQNTKNTMNKTTNYSKSLKLEKN